MISKFNKFLSDSEAREFFITGAAGTGKTTTLKKIISHLDTNKVSYTVCAYTHTACAVIAESLGVKYSTDKAESLVQTLHSFLKKRPGINDNARHIGAIDVSIKNGKSERTQIVIIDEFSFVGEKDYMDLVEMYDTDELFAPTIKVIFVGDPNQLPPVRDMQTITPKEPYHINLTKVWRTNETGLLNVMTVLNNGITNKLSLAKVETNIRSVPANDSFVLVPNLTEAYYESKCTSKLILSYTNEQVQNLNKSIHASYSDTDSVHAEVGDKVLGTRQKAYTIKKIYVDEVPDKIDTHTGPVRANSKYRTLEFLYKLDYIKFYLLEDSEGFLTYVSAIFGAKNYALTIASLQKTAVAANNAIEKISNGTKAATWCTYNKGHVLAKRRTAAWRELLAIKNSVIMLDFTYAMTVHKSQGQTFDEIYLDVRDLYKCSKRDLTLFLKLYYVGLSRASTKCYINYLPR